MVQKLKECGRQDCDLAFAFVLLYQNSTTWGALGVCLEHYADAKKTYNPVKIYHAKLFWSENRWKNFLDKQVNKLENVL